MFKLDGKTIRVRWPVTIRTPNESGGADEAPVTLHYLVPTDLSDSAADAKKTLAELIVGWDGIGDADGAALECTPAHVEAFLANPFCKQAAEQGLAEIYRGDYVRKN